MAHPSVKVLITLTVCLCFHAPIAMLNVRLLVHAISVLFHFRFVKVLGTYIPRFMLKATIPAFGIPLLIVVAVLAVDVNLYKAGDE